MQTPDEVRPDGAFVAGLTTRRRLLAVLVVALGILLALLAPLHPLPSRPAKGDAAYGSPTPAVRVALHLDEPVPDDGCVVWTAAFQAAWDRLADVLELPDGIEVAPPADPTALRALNEGRLSPGRVPDGDLEVVAGRSTDATWAAVDRASALGPPAGVRDLDHNHFVAFARLRSSVRYAVPFAVHPGPLRFGAAATPVRAYGLPKDASGVDADRMRDQVDLHVPDAPGEDLAQHVVVVLKGKAGKRVVLSGRPPKATLAATWLDVRRLIASTQAKRFSVVDELAIPRVSIRTGRSYDEIAPAAIPAIGGRLVLARQDVSLTVDERGADVDAEALLVAYGAMPRVVRFEGPFLVALLAPGSQDPYVLAWIGSPDALTAFDARVGRPPDAAQIRTLEGTWTLDPQRSLEATADHWRRISPQRKEVEDRDLVNLEEHFRTRRLRLLVRSDATVAIDTESSHKRATRVEGYLARDGARLLLIHPTVATTSEAGGERTPEDVRWTVIPGPGRLVLQAQPAGETLVLLR